MIDQTLDNFIANTLNSIRSRFAAMHGHQGADNKRTKAWSEYGYPSTVSNKDLYDLFRRNAYAFGAVNLITGTCWRTPPKLDGDNLLVETFTPSVWRELKKADTRRMAGRYSALILNINDGSLASPVKPNKMLVGVTPVWASAIKAVLDDQSKIKHYIYTETGLAGQKTEVEIHPDRVFIVGDNAIDAIGFLEPVYNNFVNIEKIEGGSGESYLKNAARQLAVNFDKEVDMAQIAQMYNISVEELQKKFNEAAERINVGSDILMVLQGATASPLVASVPDPLNHHAMNMKALAAGLGIPEKVLVGMQTGERASTEDMRQFNEMCQSRRTNELSYSISELIKHLQSIAVLNDTDFSIEWDNLSERTLEQRLENALKMSQINQASLLSGGEVFAAEEIREIAGFEDDTSYLGELADD